MTDEERKAFLKKWRRRVLLGGIALALVCKSLPPDYQAPCETLARICTFGAAP